MANSGTLPFTIYNMFMSMDIVYDWSLELILGSYSEFMLTLSTEIKLIRWFITQ